MAELTFRLRIDTGNATGELRQVETAADATKNRVESPSILRVDASTALASIRDITVAVGGALAAVKGLATGINALLDAELAQRRALTLASVAFGDSAKEMAVYASEMQSVTNFGDEEMLSMFAKMSQTFKLSTDEIKQLTPYLLDFTEATAATGMTMESAFDLMGRALNGHTEMLGRHGIELDKDRLAIEGVSYLVEKLGEDYGGTATALADLRTQNRNMWGDVQEDVGGMLAQVFNPLLKWLKAIMDAFNGLNPVLKGVIAGLVMAVPVIATVATAIVAVTAAVVALKTAINPVVGIISLVTGAVTAGAMAYGAYAASADQVADSQRTVADEITDANTQISIEAEKFKTLSTRLLELKSRTDQTAESKGEMKTVIKSMNEQYGDYLTNINMETASYNELASALSAVSEALVQKKVAEVYGEKYNAQLRKVAELQVEVNAGAADYNAAMARRRELMGTIDWDFMTSDDNAMGFNPATYFGNDGEWNKLDKKINSFGALTGRLQAAKREMNEIGEAYRQAMLGLPDLLSFDSGDGGKGGGGGTPIKPILDAADAELKEYERMVKELDEYTKDQTTKTQEEYERRLALIEKYSAEGSDIQIKAIEDLDQWKQDQDDKVTEETKRRLFEQLEAQRAATEQYYEEVKFADAGYYEWKKDQIEIEVAKLKLSTDQHNKLVKQRIAALDEEKAEWGDLSELQEEFADRSLEISNRSYDLQIKAIERYYARRKAKMIAAGITEEQITKQQNATILKLNIEMADQMLGGVSGILGDLANSMDQESEKGFRAWKGLAIAQAIVDALSAANAAYKAMAGIPGVGPGLGIAAAAAALVAGYVNVKKISETQYKPQAAWGGYLVGPGHAQGGIDIEAEGGEYIIRKDRVASLGRGFFDFINTASLDTIRTAIARIPMPVVPMPSTPIFAYATGGMVPISGANNTLIDEIRALKTAILGNRPVVNVSVDPLANHPVKIAELTERGQKLRSTY
ncbi:MAG: hypothetical protein LHW45_08170 [Candidatus Cloacimonetes bacterium]|nr:hypothetical protein [Candidatus Cloacimonadota bacterium]MDY0367584.1 hypothetical protein [Candidatus Syntrophosphaera sp.]